MTKGVQLRSHFARDIESCASLVTFLNVKQIMHPHEKFPCECDNYPSPTFWLFGKILFFLSAVVFVLGLAGSLMHCHLVFFTPVLTFPTVRICQKYLFAIKRLTPIYRATSQTSCIDLIMTVMHPIRDLSWWFIFYKVKAVNLPTWQNTNAFKICFLIKCILILILRLMAYICFCKTWVPIYI